MVVCLHREHQMVFCQYKFTVGEKNTEEVPKLLLPCAFPTGKFPLLHCSHGVYCVASKSD